MQDLKSVPVQNGGYEAPDLRVGQYRVTIVGSSHVTHVTDSVTVAPEETNLSFSVLVWNAERFGAVHDTLFQQYFHQIARVGSVGDARVRKWTAPPTELFLVEDSVPPTAFGMVRSALEQVSRETVPEMWCGLTGPMAVTTGSCQDCTAPGRIVVEPNWDLGSSGTLGPTNGGRSGRVTINVFRPRDNRLMTVDELKAILAHELFHVSFANHICGGNLGSNPWGWSPTNCPFPDSLMANLGSPLPRGLSPQDRLASCLVYHPDTHLGNTLPDTNPTYK